MSKLVSIIVPVYNVQKYIKQCLDSILNQSYKNIEIILVDDGSKDDSGYFCDCISKLDSRVKVLHKENGGLSSARNSGLEISTGEYIVFIDSDDWIELDYIEKLYSNIINYNADIAVCGVKKVWDDGKECQMTNFKSISCFNSKESMKELIKERNLNVAVWNKMYKKSLLDGIEFSVGKINEDVDWTWKIISRSNKTVVFEDLLYNYRQRSGSIMSTSASSNYKFILDCMLERHRYIESKYHDMVDDSALSIMYTCLYQGQIYLKTHKYKECLVCFRDINKVLDSLQFSTDFYKNISAKKKIRIKFITRHLFASCIIQNVLHIGI